MLTEMSPKERFALMDDIKRQFLAACRTQLRTGIIAFADAIEAGR